MTRVDLVAFDATASEAPCALLLLGMPAGVFTDPVTRERSSAPSSHQVGLWGRDDQVPGTDGQVGRHGIAVVNGPEDDVLDWLSVDWQQVEDDVRRLRQRIFTASRDGDLAKVRNLQKLMLRSQANALMSVRRVTELNAGRKTAGIDQLVVVTAPGKALLASRVQHHADSWVPKPVKRVYIAEVQRETAPARDTRDL